MVNILLNRKMYISRLNKSRILGIVFVAIFFAVLASSLGISYQDFVQSNISIPILLKDILVSFSRVTIISVIVWVIGIFVGYILHHSSLLNELHLPIINFIRHISPFAWLPFAIIWFGLGEGSVAFIMFITLFFPTLIAVPGLFADLPHEYIDEGRVLGASRVQMFLCIELPLALPLLLNLFRIIWGLGWTVIIAAEMLGVSNGMGYRLLDFRYLLKYPEMLIYLISMGFIGVVTDFFIKKIICYYKFN